MIQQSTRMSRYSTGTTTTDNNAAQCFASIVTRETNKRRLHLDYYPGYPSTRGLNAVPNCGTVYYNLARSILVLQFEVDQALHLARANLARHFT